MTANGAGAEQHAAVLYDRTGVDAIAFTFLLRNRLTGQHRFIQPGFALRNFSIDRHAVAGGQAQQHSRLNVCQRHVLFTFVSNDACGRWRQIKQFFQRFGRALASPRFQHVSEVNQTNNHGAGFIIEVSRFHWEPLRPEVDAHGIEPGHPGSERHQRIHGRGAVHQAFPRIAVKVTARENHHRKRCQTNRQPQAAVVIAHHHVVANHSPYHDRDTQQQRDGCLPAKTFHGCHGGFLLTLAAFSIIFNGFCAVTRFFYRLH